MADYDEATDRILELSRLRGEMTRLGFEFFELRDRYLDRPGFWTLAGAGSSQELAAAVRSKLGGDRGALTDYWYFPPGKHNPYLDLLYSRMAGHGFRPRELDRFAGVAELGGSGIVHVHWIESLRPNGDDEQANLDALDDARRIVDRFVADSTNTLVWSVHEPLPHGSRWPDQDAAFHQFLADRADVIHVLHPDTAESCAEYFTIDEAKSLCVGLPLYTGVYPNYRSRTESRALLGVAPDELCVAFVGALRAYKGVDQLVEAAAEARRSRPLRLLVAGMAVGDVDDLVARVEPLDWAAIAPMLVPDSEMQTLLGAADVLVVPYQRFLNSAVLMLGLTFGLRVLATENPVTVDARDSGLVTTYRSPEELASLLAALPLESSAVLNDDFAAAHSSDAIATEFATGIARVVDAGRTDPTG